MNILHVSTIHEWRGGDAQMYTIYNLIKDDFKQIILCPRNSVLEKKCLEKAINVYSSPRKGNFDFRFSYKMYRVCKKEQINILHVHDSTALTLALFFIYLLPEVQLVYSRKRNNAIKDKFLNRWKYKHKLIKKIICVSKAVERVFYPIDIKREKLQVIYDGIRVEKNTFDPDLISLRREYGLPPDSIIVGNIAGLTKQKDIFTFINTAEIMLKQMPELYFFVIGGGPLKNELVQYTEAKKLNSRLFFTGFRPNARLLLKTFDLLLMSSKEEGLPLTVYEAFAEQVPVVATEAGGITEVINNGETGFCSPVKDAQSLAENALKILNDQALKEKMTLNSLKLVREKFTLPVMKKNYIRFYHALMT